MDESYAEGEWCEHAKRLLKAELKMANVTYDELARRLNSMGFTETKASIASKLTRGTYPATFLLASLKAIGRETISISGL